MIQPAISCVAPPCPQQAPQNLVKQPSPFSPCAAAGRNYQKIQKAICSGFFFHAARKDPQEGYKTGGCSCAIRLFVDVGL